MFRIALVLTLCGFAFCAYGEIAETALRVLPETIDGVPARDMMRAYLLKKIDAAWTQWQADFEAVDTPEKIAAYQARTRAKFVEMLGGFPERTPLNPQVTGVIRKDGYRIEKVLFESQPKHYVSANLYVPESDRWKPPYAGVLVPCGHSANGKAYESYQSVCALLALNGMAAFIFDPIEQGERIQLFDFAGKPLAQGTKAHTMVGVGSILLGRNTATFEIWDGMRAMDYLAARPEVDAERLGCTGNSGGGTQTSFLMALDDRIKAAAPSCYLNRAGRQLEVSPGDAEQNIFGQLAWGMDHADLIMMRAPSPVLICAATEDFFDIEATWDTFRYAKRRYTAMGYPERVSLLENNAKHGLHKPQREGIARWMARWLQGRDEVIVEPELDLCEEEELWATPEGRVMGIKGARTTYNYNRILEAEYAKVRAERWANEDKEKLLDEVRSIAGIRRLEDIPEPEVEVVGREAYDGYTVEKRIIKPEPGIWLPALVIEREDSTGIPTLQLHDEGTIGRLAEDFVRTGDMHESENPLWIVGLRGLGETQQTAQDKFKPWIGTDWEDYFAAYTLGLSYVGMRVEDVLVCARLARGANDSVKLFSTGDVGVAALHAAALEEDLFGRIEIRDYQESWANVVKSRPIENQLVNAVHGALAVYDLPNLVQKLRGGHTKHIDTRPPTCICGRASGWPASLLD